MHVVIFEASHWTSFLPLCLNRPLFMLQTGMTTLFEKHLRHFSPTRLTIWIRPELAESTEARVVSKLKIPASINTPLDDEPALLVNGRSLHLRKYEFPPEPCVAIDEHNFIVEAFVKAPGLSPQDALERSERWMKLQDLPRTEPQGRLVESLSDLISWNEESLIEDSVQLRGKPRPFPNGPFHGVNSEDVWLGNDVKLEPGVVLDASQGAIVLGDSVKIGANSVLYGPLHIAHHAQVRPLSLVRGGTSIGRLCKIGGEIQNSIMLGHSNKAHDGFLGHSYLGKWVNFGAGTTTSNLKNTYGEVKLQIGSRELRTGRQFFGSLVGDHVKTAIGTRLMTGTYVGFCSMLAGSGLPPKFIPTLSFWTDKGLEPYQIDKAVKVMKAAYSRRDLEWTPGDERILEYVKRVAPEVEK